MRIPLEGLTKRELQCLHYAALGCSMQETADALSLSRETIRTHRKVIFRKFGCRNILEAVVIAIERKLLAK